MQDLLASYRWRRRLAWSGGSIAVCAAVVLLIVFLPTRSGPKHPGVRPGKPTNLAIVQPEVPVTPRQRRSVNETLTTFIRTGVMRADPSAAWPLVTPSMRSGISHAAWNRGELPVTPYPAKLPKRLDWRVITSYKDDLTLDLVLQPRAGARQGPIDFAVEVKRGRSGRWLVDSMVPQQVFAPAGPSTPRTKPVAVGPGAKELGPHGRLSPLWFAIPGALLGLVILVPLAVVLLSWRRSRAIERRYRRERGL